MAITAEGAQRLCVTPHFSSSDGLVPFPFNFGSLDVCFIGSVALTRHVTARWWAPTGLPEGTGGEMPSLRPASEGTCHPSGGRRRPRPQRCDSLEKSGEKPPRPRRASSLRHAGGGGGGMRVNPPTPPPPPPSPRAKETRTASPGTPARPTPTPPRAAAGRAGAGGGFRGRGAGGGVPSPLRPPPRPLPRP